MRAAGDVRHLASLHKPATHHIQDSIALTITDERPLETRNPDLLPACCLRLLCKTRSLRARAAAEEIGDTRL